MKKLYLALALIGAAIAAPNAVAQVVVLTPEVADTLALMREEEKLSHDVYAVFDVLYEEETPGGKIFGRIAEAEARHAEAVGKLLLKYGLPDPAYPEPGQFLNQDLQELYDTLVGVGSAGLTEALGVGVFIEQKDMTDLVEAIEISAAYADIVKVYASLLAGSERHLSSFLKVLDAAEVEADLELDAAQVAAGQGGRGYGGRGR